MTHPDGLSTFFGIPYAAPPVGKLRWAPPAPIRPWSGVRDARRASPQCLQPTSLNPFYVTPRERTDEDCLYLNVWTRAEAADANLPVMVWVHGGALVEGAGELYWGDRLSLKGVLVVTINYRLGPFGFFAHPDLTAENSSLGSGNQGIRDQIAALRWVRDNIRHFGGDPNNVTIFGESAGAWSMSVLQASPMARGLFHKVIGESGARFLPLPYLHRSSNYAPSAEARGRRLARVFAAGKELDLAQLRALPASQIMGAYQRDSSVLWNFDALVIVDGQVLPDQVYDIFSRGAQADVPVLLGSNEDEAATFNPDALDPRTPDTLDYGALMRSSVETLLPELDQSVFDLYPIGSSSQAKRSYVDFQTDVQFTQPMRVWADKMTNVRSAAYLYWWNRRPPVAGTGDLGAFHGAEVPYVFDMLGERSPSGFKIEDRPEEQAFADLIMTLWSTFAKTGNPSVAGTVDWPAYSPDAPWYMVLGDQCVARQGMRDRQVLLITEAFNRRRAGSPESGRPTEAASQ